MPTYYNRVETERVIPKLKFNKSAPQVYHIRFRVINYFKCGEIDRGRENGGLLSCKNFNMVKRQSRPQQPKLAMVT